MHTVSLNGCNTRPFGSYLKALGVFRLVSEQADSEARAWWEKGVLHVRSTLDAEQLAAFFEKTYRPTPILAPWNGGSGFYQKDRKVGIEAIASSKSERFAEYRTAITLVRGLAEVQAGKAEKNEEEVRRTAILRHCRNRLPDGAVEWLDASIGIAADGSRSFAPVLGTGGNEGRLDYTNNFMERIAALLIEPDKKTPVQELLRNSLFGTPTDALQTGAASGQYDPGRAGGANQGEGIEGGVATNPWDFVLTLEGAVAWASGLYRRQGASYRTVLCSPFTVHASRVGYGSASDQDDSRAEIWTPIWGRPARYAELKVVLREGRANVDGRPAKTGMDFARAATSLGVDRGIQRFVRYSLLKRRGDSYVALPTGEFATGYRSESDRVREMQAMLSRIDRREFPPGCEGLWRGIENAMFEALLKGGKDRIRELMTALGALLRRLSITGKEIRIGRDLEAQSWIQACDPELAEVRIAAALASLWDPKVGALRDNLLAGGKSFAWVGRDLPDRMISVIQRRLQTAAQLESKNNPFGGACRVSAGDATLFIEGSTDDALIEDLVFSFTCLNWAGFRSIKSDRTEVLPVYALLKHLFLPGTIDPAGEQKRIWPDPRVISQLRAGRIGEAAEIAKHRLRVAGAVPVNLWYDGGVDGRRLAAALLIPVRTTKQFATAALRQELTYTKGN
jgi:CRISPR-associated protein Csx17